MTQDAWVIAVDTLGCPFAGCDTLCDKPYVSFEYTVDGSDLTVSLRDSTLGDAVHYTWDPGTGDWRDKYFSGPNAVLEYDEPGLYTVCLTVQRICGPPAKYCEEIPVFYTGMEHPGPTTPTVRLYPNPAAAQLTAEVNLATSDVVKARLSGIDGRAVWRSNIFTQTSTFEIDVKGLPAGIYIFEIQDEAGQVLRAEKVAVGY